MAAPRACLWMHAPPLWRLWAALGDVREEAGRGSSALAAAYRDHEVEVRARTQLQQQVSELQEQVSVLKAQLQASRLEPLLSQTFTRSRVSHGSRDKLWREQNEKIPM